MSSERRLHPWSLVLGMGSALREFAAPALFVIVTAGAIGDGWDPWWLLLLGPFGIYTTLRYLTFRYRFDAGEMVVRSGVLFRNERHVPYSRVQNLDTVQHALHRLLGVVEVRVQTGSGDEPEAKMNAVSWQAYEEMRRHIFPAAPPPRTAAAAPDDAETRALGSADAERELLRLRPRELVRYGLIENRGSVLVAALFGLVWELGLFDRVMGWTFAEGGAGRRLGGQFVRAVFEGRPIPLSWVAYACLAAAALLLVMRVVSMIWAVVRLYGYTVVRAGDDLRIRHGLVTRVTGTIPLRRIQTVTIRDSPLHRLFGSVSVQVTTAGGYGEDNENEGREDLAPLADTAHLHALLGEILPEVDRTPAWQPAAAGAFRRVLRQSLAVALVFGLASAWLLWWWSVVFVVLLSAWAVWYARGYVAGLGWAVTERTVHYRRGWVWRRTSVAPVQRIQVAATHESPFDRRTNMARLVVDTAGGSGPLEIPFVGRDEAREALESLHRAAGQRPAPP